MRCEEQECCCDFEHDVDEWCPQCCPYEGVFAGGTEECEFCDYAEFCQDSLEEEEHHT